MRIPGLLVLGAFVTVICLLWIMYLYATAGVVITDLNFSAFRTLSPEQGRHLVETCLQLFWLAVIPLSVTNGIWMGLAVWFGIRNKGSSAVAGDGTGKHGPLLRHDDAGVEQR
jgi:hypothetical protein